MEDQVLEVWSFVCSIDLLIGTFGLWTEMMSTLGLVITGVIISLILGIPVEYSAYSDRLEVI